MTTMSSIFTDRSIYVNRPLDTAQEAGLNGQIIILADTGVAFQGLVHAAQQYFQKYEVTLRAELPEQDQEIGPASIVLIHAGKFRDVATIVRDSRLRYPETPIGLMVEEDWREIAGLESLIAGRLVQGLLPFNMQMNVWLATVWLLVNGGEYFPSAVMPRMAASALTRSGLDGRRLQRTDGPERLLSNRENQVLELMSEGLQNKLIAAKMELSEHTVKVHVHNIIRKLRVHNRTQAAAVYRSAV